MRAGALSPYELALGASGPLAVHAVDDGRVIELDVARWLGGIDAADETVLTRVRGPVLDIGCGPGRFVAALNARGVPALGVDIAETAIALTRRQGVPGLLRDVFRALPGEGRWPTVMLMDGNIGIGGDPRRLLQRAGELLAPHGRMLVEVDADDARDDVLEVRFGVGGGAVGPAFGWALVGRTAALRYAEAAGYAPGELWSSAGRTFVALARRSRITRDT